MMNANCTSHSVGVIPQYTQMEQWENQVLKAWYAAEESIFKWRQETEPVGQGPTVREYHMDQ